MARPEINLNLKTHSQYKQGVVLTNDAENECRAQQLKNPIRINIIPKESPHPRDPYPAWILQRNGKSKNLSGFNRI